MNKGKDETTDKPLYPGTDTNKELPFQSPQTEESNKLNNLNADPAVVRKNEEKEDHGETRGGNYSVNQD